MFQNCQHFDFLPMVVMYFPISFKYPKSIKITKVRSFLISQWNYPIGGIRKRSTWKDYFFVPMVGLKHPVNFTKSCYQFGDSISLIQLVKLHFFQRLNTQYLQTRFQDYHCFCAKKKSQVLSFKIIHHYFFLIVKRTKFGC